MPPSEDMRALAQSLFGTVREKGFLVPAQHNPNVDLAASLSTNPEQVFTLATLTAAKTFAGLLEMAGKRLPTVDDILAVRAQGNIVTFGSPTSNLITRAVMSYREIGDGRGGSEHHPLDGLHLPILFELDGERIRNSDSVYKVVRGRGKQGDE